MPEECSTSNKQFFLVTPKTKTKQKLHKKDFHSSLHYYRASGTVWKETLPRSSGGKTKKKKKKKKSLQKPQKRERERWMMMMMMMINGTSCPTNYSCGVSSLIISKKL
jgi:hypothetical protein